MKVEIFNMPEGMNQMQLLADLSEKFSIVEDKTVTQNYTLYDTFDWRLFNEKLVLQHSNNILSVRALSSKKVIDRVPVTQPPGFVWDLPESVLQLRLASIIEMRKLLNLATVHVNSTTYRLLNKDAKTVVRLAIEELRLTPQTSKPASTTYVYLHQVRGYPKAANTLAQALQQLKLTPDKNSDIYFSIMAAAGKNPSAYSSKPQFEISAQMRADEATKIIMRSLIDIIRLNEPYVKQDVDTEFLHDFRVALRRTRSALSQIRAVFPAEVTVRFKQDLAHLGRLTNQLRDLDVYLLDKDTYKAMLPEILQDDIDPLFAMLQQQRAKALKDVIKGLNSKVYQNILRDWEVFLQEDTPESDSAPNAGRPIVDLAQERIYKRYRRIVKSGQAILANTEDELLHDLRIECKKLRYLLEFFNALFPAKKVKFLIRQLKVLQNNLGDFNDLCVQGEYLLNAAGSLPTSDPKSQKMMLAIGALVGTLDNERIRVKEEFAETFLEFVAPANKALFKQLFAPHKENK